MIKRLIAHKIVKEAKQTTKCELIKRESLINSDTDAANHLFASTKKTLRNRGAVGTFSRKADGENESPFEDFTKEYIENATDKSFHDYSIKSANSLKTNLQKVVAATGGYLVFIHCLIGGDSETLGKENIIVALVSEHEMPVFDEALNLVENQILDLEKLKHCVRIRIEHLEDNTDQVVTFLTGRGSGEVALYFKSFIGCENTTSSKQTAKKLKDRLSDWATAENLTPEQRSSMFKNVYGLWEEKDGYKKGLAMTTLAHCICEDSQVDSFVEFMTAESGGLAGDIGPIKKADMNGFKQFRYKSKDFIFQVDADEWMNNVHYEESSDMITIKAPPKDLAEMVEKHHRRNPN